MENGVHFKALKIAYLTQHIDIEGLPHDRERDPLQLAKGTPHVAVNQRPQSVGSLRQVLRNVQRRFQHLKRKRKEMAENWCQIYFMHIGIGWWR